MVSDIHPAGERERLAAAPAGVIDVSTPPASRMKPGRAIATFLGAGLLALLVPFVILAFVVPIGAAIRAVIELLSRLIPLG